MKCIKCGSFAINENSYERVKGEHSNLCDPHYWQEKHSQLQAEVEALRKDAEWQPIETAPKDYVTEFDGWNGERITNISWEHPAYSPKGHFAWCVSEYVAHHGHDNVEVKGLTHWKPLPPPPAIKEQS